MNTKWVLTIPFDDGAVAHVEDPDEGELRRLITDIEKKFGPGEYRIEEKALTWECDGRDGCTIDA